MEEYSKIAVFDLDGTLWDVNSHHEILNQYYKCNFWTSFLFKILFKVLPKKITKIRDMYFNRIPDSFIDSIQIPFNNKYIELLKEKYNEGYHIIIISNAPHELIVKNAATRLQCDWLCSPEGKKLTMLEKKYKYDYLFVCTDNRTDIDLLEQSNEYQIVTKRNNKRFFRIRGYYVK